MNLINKGIMYFLGLVAALAIFVVIAALPSLSDQKQPSTSLVDQAPYGPNEIVLTGKIVASDSAPNNRFGSAVAIDGDRMVVGASNDFSNDTTAGSAYVFEKHGGVWRQTAKLMAAGIDPSAMFGDVVELEGDIVIVTARLDDENGADAGSAYVFENQNGRWNQTAKLTADDGTQGAFFGSSVAINRGTILIGAREADGADIKSGATYVFERVNNTWAQTAKLMASDGTAKDWFGFAVSITNGVAVVGAPRDPMLFEKAANPGSGAGYVFEKKRADWVQTAKLTASDKTAGDTFGAAVAASGSTIIVGADKARSDEVQAGAVYVFERNDNKWQETRKIAAPNPAHLNVFGWGVALDDDLAVVGAPGESIKKMFGILDTDNGGAYLLRKGDGQWHVGTRLVSGENQALGSFGKSVDVYQNTVAVGAPGDDSEAGAVYVLEL